MYYKFKNNNGEDEQSGVNFTETLICSDVIQSVMISDKILKISLISEEFDIDVNEENKAEIEKLLAELTNEKPLKNKIQMPTMEMFEPILDVINGLGIGVYNVKVEKLEEKALSMLKTDGLTEFQIEHMTAIIVILLMEGVLDDYEDSEDNQDVVTNNLLNVIQISFQGENYNIHYVEESESICVSVAFQENSQERHFDCMVEVLAYFKSLLDD